MGKLSASILAADFVSLAEEVKLVEPYAEVIHVDVMNGRFVSPLTIGPVVVASLRPVTERVLHGHLMVEAVHDPAPVIRKAREPATIAKGGA